MQVVRKVYRYAIYRCHFYINIGRRYIERPSQTRKQISAFFSGMIDSNYFVNIVTSQNIKAIFYRRSVYSNSSERVSYR